MSHIVHYVYQYDTSGIIFSRVSGNGPLQGENLVNTNQYDNLRCMLYDPDTNTAYYPLKDQDGNVVLDGEGKASADPDRLEEAIQL